MTLKTIRPAISALLFLALTALSSSAQQVEKKEFTYRQAVQAPFAFFPRAHLGLSWHGDGEHFSYLEREGTVVQFVLETAADGEKKTLFTDKEFKAAAEAAALKGLPITSLAGATWRKDPSELELDWQGNRLAITIDPLKIRKVFEYPASAEATTITKDRGQFAYVNEHNVHVMKRDGKTVQVTSSGFRHLTHGVAVHRVEFGIQDGMWWDPAGRRLAFYREDLRVTDDLPIIDWKSYPAKLDPERYPMAGTTNGKVSIGIYDSRDDSTRWLEIAADCDDWLTNVTWGPKGERIYVAQVVRSQDSMTLKSYDAATGKFVADLFTEKDEQWIEPEHGPIFVPDGSGNFLWFSPRDGFEQLYLYSADGHLLQQLTKARADVSAFRGFDAEGKGFYFESSGKDPRQKHLFHASLGAPDVEVRQGDARDLKIIDRQKAPRALTSGRGTHQTLVSGNGKWILDRHSNLELPLAIDLRNGEGKTLRRLHESKNLLKDYRVGREGFFETRTDDGQTLYGHRILPPDMKPGQKYPVLLYVYSGPHSQFVRDEWLGGLGGTNLWLHYMATQGFVCFRIDGRGTLNRGIEWQQVLHRQLGTHEIKDQVAGLDHIIAEHQGDPARVGVTGWSYGGFMTLSLMTRAGERFAAGVSGAPVTDWRYYETGYGERYMDTPQENPEGYKKANPGEYVKGIKGRLLVVHGSSDVTVVWQHTMDFLDRCIQAGVDVDYFVYPGQLHGLRGKHRAHFYRKMTDYFLRELKP